MKKGRKQKEKLLFVSLNSTQDKQHYQMLQAIAKLGSFEMKPALLACIEATFLEIDRELTRRRNEKAAQAGTPAAEESNDGKSQEI